MAAKPTRQPPTKMLPLHDLIPRADQANVMIQRTRNALVRHIAASGRYPALVVRAHPRRSGKYEILDGSVRAEILRTLGANKARCEIWEVADPEALILSGTLNELRGRADARRRAPRTRRIVRRLGLAGALAALGLTPAALRQQFALLHPKRPELGSPALDLTPVVFHVSPDDA
ncbi:MAG TPA: ParB/RepB/Spo0J family partition protein, partial [Phycisphaerae bacterium]|nr:ParB/RepB/Spo0J family partition protein [Phycisphaerae bacterium]